MAFERQRCSLGLVLAWQRRAWLAGPGQRDVAKLAKWQGEAPAAGKRRPVAAPVTPADLATNLAMGWPPPCSLPPLLLLPIHGGTVREVSCCLGCAANGRDDRSAPVASLTGQSNRLGAGRGLHKRATDQVGDGRHARGRRSRPLPLPDDLISGCAGDRVLPTRLAHRTVELLHLPRKAAGVGEKRKRKRR
jgi:hypothetical protein